jgi:hypothetical protein
MNDRHWQIQVEQSDSNADVEFMIRAFCILEISIPLTHDR